MAPSELETPRREGLRSLGGGVACHGGPAQGAGNLLRTGAVHPGERDPTSRDWLTGVIDQANPSIQETPLIEWVEAFVEKNGNL
jgi:hypothetical protein